MEYLNDDDFPLVTIIIIAYNLEAYLGEAIESCLNQDYSNIEIIVVDDGSTDDTRRVACRYHGVKLIVQNNSGSCASPRNVGIQQARGKYISFLDGDDKYLTKKISRQVSLLKEFPKCRLIISNYQNFRSNVLDEPHFSSCTMLMELIQAYRNSYAVLPIACALDILIEENYSIAGAPLYETCLIKELIGYNEKLKACEDYELVYRAILLTPIIIDSNVALLRRLHGNNLSSNKVKMLNYYIASRVILSVVEKDTGRSNKLSKKANDYLKSLMLWCLKNRKLTQALGGIYIYFASRYWANITNLQRSFLDRSRCIWSLLVEKGRR